MCTIRDGAAGFLTPKSLRSGLDGPMPVTIALVVTGRCRPSPDRVPWGESADGDARSIVSAGLSGGQAARRPGASGQAQASTGVRHRQRDEEVALGEVGQRRVRRSFHHRGQADVCFDSDAA